MPRATEPMQRSRINPVNVERRARLFERQFLSDAYVAFIHSQPCAVRGCRRVDIVCAHVVRTRACGGRWYEMAPMCGRDWPGHHQKQEGRTAAFDREHGTDLEALAARLAMDWMIFTKGEV